MTILSFLTPLLVIIFYSTSSSGKLLHLELYYETLCPDCIDFTRQVFTEVLPSLEPYIDFEWIPFGNAKYFEAPNDDFTFECQHGPDECIGNKIHACLLYKVNNSTLQNKYASCLMMNNSNLMALKTCLKDDVTLLSQVSKCYKGKEGNIYLHEFGVRTESLSPPHKWTPWLVINGKPLLESESLNNLKKYLCRVFLSSIPECKVTFNVLI